MIRIFNQKLDVNIKIDDSEDWVQMTPNDYDVKPYILIELINFEFPRHANSCKDCKQFLKAFGTVTYNWFVDYSGKIQRIDTEFIG